MRRAARIGEKGGKLMKKKYYYWPSILIASVFISLAIYFLIASLNKFVLFGFTPEELTFFSAVCFIFGGSFFVTINLFMKSDKKFSDTVSGVYNDFQEASKMLDVYAYTKQRREISSRRLEIFRSMYFGYLVHKVESEINPALARSKENPKA